MRSDQKYGILLEEVERAISGRGGVAETLGEDKVGVKMA
jgi:hypothetical protein